MKKNKNKQSTVKDCNKVNNSMKNTNNSKVQNSNKAMGFDDDESHSFMLDDDNDHSFKIK